VTFNPTPEQQAVIDAEDPVLIVVGGAGTGKTSIAALAAHTHLVAADEKLKASRHVAWRSGEDPSANQSGRVLFLSFSRASTARVLERIGPLLVPYRDRVEITTYHALAWRLIKQWGALIGQPEPRLLSPAEAKLFTAPDVLQYRDLVPEALQACAISAVGDHLRRRWSLIICDEFQDTSEEQWTMLLALRGRAKLLLLADPNQCIYSELPDAHGVGPERLAAALTLPGARRVDLPEASHRDPTGVIPAAAAAIRRRAFDHDAIQFALETGRLAVITGVAAGEEAQAVAREVEHLRSDGSTVAVFSHHNDALADLSDQLLTVGVEHEVLGLPECFAAALDAQHAIMAFAAGQSDWNIVRQRLAVFVVSTVRGKLVPPLAQQILGRSTGSRVLVERLQSLGEHLAGAAPTQAVEIALSAYDDVGLLRGGRAWERAGSILRSALAGALRYSGDTNVAMERLERLVEQRRATLLTAAAAEEPAPVQLMGLYQTKGREADAAVVILRENDFFGYERSEPFEVGSRLLYVVFTRARHHTVILTVGRSLPLLVAPLARLDGR
jgi:DNA helicase-2/ATP-dependent DNA helicase PcrA